MGERTLFVSGTLHDVLKSPMPLACWIGWLRICGSSAGHDSGGVNWKLLLEDKCSLALCVTELDELSCCCPATLPTSKLHAPHLQPWCTLDVRLSGLQLSMLP